MKNSKGQIAIFVIASLIIVAMIVLVLIVRGGPNIPIPGEAFSPESYLSSCVRDVVNSESAVMMKQGGFVAPRDYANYNNEKVSYLCKNVNYYEPCVNQYPRYVESVRLELQNNVKEQVKTCLEALDAELQRQQYDVERTPEPIVRVDLQEDNVVVESEVSMTLSKGGVSQQYDTMTTKVRVPLFNLVTVANEIVRQESEFCYFSNDGFSLIYPEFDIRRDMLQEGTKIYTIKHTATESVMTIAIRGCVIPQGVG
jgi:hypothetical protein